MSKAKRHVHKYHHIDTAFGKVWACALPDCNHYMPQHMESLLVGKRAFCWECGDTIILDNETMKDDKPKCLACRTGISKDDISEAEMDDRMKKLKELLN